MKPMVEKSLLNRVLGILASLACFYTDVLGMLTCLLAGCAYTLTCPRVRMLNMVACFVSLRAPTSYMLAVCIYLTHLRTCVLGVLFFPISFTSEKLNSKKAY